MGRFKIDVDKVKDITIVRARGKLTVENSTVEQLTQRFNELLEAGNRRFIFNLSKVHWVDSPGLGQLMLFYKSLQEHGGIMKTIPSPWIADVVDDHPEMRVLDLHETEESALASFKELGQ